ncbi:MAG: ABC transporter substrate-binding protein [Proteobacteria bacterium]|nr:ABC transporter substrate-binding protein [Pseudomonadota bacterium]MBU1417299.1 ABC transporter substrate-binding protein [Pseudomonadota bacterium]MBU1454116.1 ABC transporter substrate-binding protein [Pseudomonadota bacterium]
MRKKTFVQPLLFVLFVLLLLGGCDREPQPIKLGLSINLSGLGGEAGEQIRDGALLAVDAVNSQGGINGRPLELLVRDDENSDEGIARADQSLINEGVVAIVGHSYSSTTVKAYPLVMKNEVLLITAYTGTGSLSGKDDFFFRTAVDTTLYGEKVAALLNEKKISSVSFLMDMSNPAFVVDYKEKTERNFSGRVTEVRFDSKQENDWQQIVADLMVSDPDAIIFLTEASMTGVALQKLASSGYDGLRIATLWAQTPGLMRYAGGAVEGLLVVSFINPDNHSPQWLEFSEKMEAQFKKKATARSGRACELVMILADALRRCSVITPAELKKALLAGEYQTLMGQVRFDSFGDVNRPVYQIIVRDGAFHTVKEL